MPDISLGTGHLVVNITGIELSLIELVEVTRVSSSALKTNTKEAKITALVL